MSVPCLLSTTFARPPSLKHRCSRPPSLKLVAQNTARPPFIQCPAPGLLAVQSMCTRPALLSSGPTQLHITPPQLQHTSDIACNTLTHHPCMPQSASTPPEGRPMLVRCDPPPVVFHTTCMLGELKVTLHLTPTLKHVSDYVKATRPQPTHLLTHAR